MITFCQLIVTKFQYPNGGDVNYVAFIQAIDEEYTGQAMEQETPRYIKFAILSTVNVKYLHSIFPQQAFRFFQ